MVALVLAVGILSGAEGSFVLPFASELRSFEASQLALLSLRREFIREYFPAKKKVLQKPA